MFCLFHLLFSLFIYCYYLFIHYSLYLLFIHPLFSLFIYCYCLFIHYSLYLSIVTVYSSIIPFIYCLFIHYRLQRTSLIHVLAIVLLHMYWEYVIDIMIILWSENQDICFILTLVVSLVTLKCLDQLKETESPLFSHLIWPMLSMLEINHLFDFKSSLIYVVMLLMNYENTLIFS